MFSFTLTVLALTGCEPTTSSAPFKASDAYARISGRYLEVSQDPSAPGPDIVVGGESNVHVGTFRFQAVGEPMELTDFTLVNRYDDETISSVMVRYEDVDGETMESYGFLVEGEVEFSGEEVYVPSDDHATVEVYVATNTEVVADPGMLLQLDWVDDEVEVIGLISGEVFGPERATNYVASAIFEWHTTKPTITLSEDSPTEDEGAERLCFFVAADSGGELGIEELFFQLHATDNEGTSWNHLACGDGGLEEDDFFLAIDDGVVDSDWTLYTRRRPCGEVQVVRVTLDTAVSAGEVRTFEFNMAADGATPGDQLLVELIDVTWTDQGIAFDGSLLERLPLLGNTISLD